MPSQINDIINRLRREILPLGGLSTSRYPVSAETGLGFMSEAFPQGEFPLGSVHELISEKRESAQAGAPPEWPPRTAIGQGLKLQKKTRLMPRP